MPAEIIVRGEAELRVMPDHASVRIDIDGEGTSQADAYETAAMPAEAVDAVLKAHANAIDRVATAALVVAPKTRWRKGETVRTGWRASRTTFVEITTLEEIGALLAELARAGGTVSGPWWQLASDNRAHDAVRTAAAKDARRRADAYADGLGLVVGDVAWIAEPGLRSTSPDDPWVGAVAGAMMSGGGAPEEESIAVTAEEITLAAAVEVGYLFQPASPSA